MSILAMKKSNTIERSWFLQRRLEKSKKQQENSEFGSFFPLEIDGFSPCVRVIPEYVDHCWSMLLVKHGETINFGSKKTSPTYPTCFAKSWTPKHHPVVIDDHDVLKQPVTGTWSWPWSWLERNQSLVIVNDHNQHVFPMVNTLDISTY